MKTFLKKTALAATVTLAFLASAANAANPLTVGLGTNGGPVNNEGSTPLNSFSFDGFAVTVNAQGVPDTFYPQILSTNAIDVSHTGGNLGTTSLEIWITESDLTYDAAQFVLGFTSNQIIGGWKIAESAYVDSSNGLFGGTQIGSTFITTNPNSTSATVGALFPVSGLYSVSVLYQVSNPLGGNIPGGTVNGTITVAVPEPETYAMMLAGLGLMGFIARRRKQNNAA